MIKIKEANKANLCDLNEVFSLYQEFYETEEKLINKESNIAFFNKILDNPLLGKQFLVYFNNNVIGFITLYYTFSSLSKMKVGIMNDLYLKKDYRGKGYGKEMIKFVGEYLKTKGITKMVWETHPDNINAQRLYDNIGGIGELWKIYELEL